MRLAEYLHTATGEPPSEYTTLILCRDVFHCTPDELNRQRARDIWRALTCIDMETRIHKLKSKTGRGM